MSNDFFSYCVEFMKTDEFKKCMKPFLSMIMQEIYPYIYISMLFVFVAFFLILAIFVLLVREKTLK